MSQSGLTVKLLGVPEASINGSIIKTSTQKGLALLYYLAVKDGPVPRFELEDLLWANSAGNNLRQALHNLRSFPGMNQCLIDKGGLTLRASCDLHAFQHAVQTHRYDLALTLWQQAGDLRGRDAFLTDFELKRAPAFMDWLEFERSRIEMLYHDALQGRISQLEQERRDTEVMELVKVLLREDPLNESAYRTAMRTLYRNHEVQAALAYYETCRRVLAQELGIEPLEETRNLARFIERRLEHNESGQRTFRQRVPLEFLSPPSLIGREVQWQALHDAWHLRQHVVLVGDTGVGKSRLLREFVQQNVRDARYGIMAEGQRGDSVTPFSSIARLVEQLLPPSEALSLEPWVAQAMARLLPARFGNVEPDPALEPQHVQDAVWHVLSSSVETGALVLEDLHHYDSASLDSIINLVLRFSQAHSEPRVLASVSLSELPQAMRPLIEQVFVQESVTRIDVPPFDPGSVRALLKSLRVELSQELAAKLHRYTGGNLLFVLESLKVLYTNNRLASDTVVLQPSARVSSLLARRFERLSSNALILARLLSLTQASPSQDHLSHALHLPVSAVQAALAELEQAHIFREGSFTSDVIPGVLAQSCSDVLQRTLYAGLARAFDETGDEPAHAAMHYLQAGNPARAAHLYLKAATSALQHFADDEAKSFLFRCLWSTREGTLQADALLELLRLTSRSGDRLLYQAALEQLEQITHELQRDDLIFEAKNYRASERIHAGNPKEAALHAEEALEIAKRLKRDDLRYRASHILGGAYFHLGNLDDAKAYFLDASKTPDDTMRQGALNNLGALAGMRAQFEEAYSYQAEVLTLARKHGNIGMIAAALHNIAGTAEKLARYDKAQAYIDETLKLFDRSRDPKGYATSLLSLADIHLKAGAYGPAAKAIAEAHAIFEHDGAPQQLSRTETMRGELERKLGRSYLALTHLEAALRHAQESRDERSVAVAQLNYELCRLEAGQEQMVALMTALEHVQSFRLHIVVAWANLELANMSRSSTEAHARVEQALAAHDNSHLRLVAQLALLRAQLLEGHTGNPEPLHEHLRQFTVAESPRGYLLVARALESQHPQRTAELQARARALMLEQAQGLTSDHKAALYAQFQAWCAYLM